MAFSAEQESVIRSEFVKLRSEFNDSSFWLPEDLVYFLQKKRAALPTTKGNRDIPEEALNRFEKEILKEITASKAKVDGMVKALEVGYKSTDPSQPDIVGFRDIDDLDVLETEVFEKSKAIRTRALSGKQQEKDRYIALAALERAARERRNGTATKKGITQEEKERLEKDHKKVAILFGRYIGERKADKSIKSGDKKDNDLIKAINADIKALYPAYTGNIGQLFRIGYEIQTELEATGVPGPDFKKVKARLVDLEAEVGNTGIPGDARPVYERILAFYNLRKKEADTTLTPNEIKELKDALYTDESKKQLDKLIETMTFTQSQLNELRNKGVYLDNIDQLTQQKLETALQSLKQDGAVIQNLITRKATLAAPVQEQLEFIEVYYTDLLQDIEILLGSHTHGIPKDYEKDLTDWLLFTHYQQSRDVDALWNRFNAKNIVAPLFQQDRFRIVELMQYFTLAMTQLADGSTGEKGDKTYHQKYAVLDIYFNRLKKMYDSLPDNKQGFSSKDEVRVAGDESPEAWGKIYFEEYKGDTTPNKDNFRIRILKLLDDLEVAEARFSLQTEFSKSMYGKRFAGMNYCFELMLSEDSALFKQFEDLQNYLENRLIIIDMMGPHAVSSLMTADFMALAEKHPTYDTFTLQYMMGNRPRTESKNNFWHGALVQKIMFMIENELVMTPDWEEKDSAGNWLPRLGKKKLKDPAGGKKYSEGEFSFGAGKWMSREGNKHVSLSEHILSKLVNGGIDPNTGEYELKSKPGDPWDGQKFRKIDIDRLIRIALSVDTLSSARCKLYVEYYAVGISPPGFLELKEILECYPIAKELNAATKSITEIPSILMGVQVDKEWLLEMGKKIGIFRSVDTVNVLEEFRTRSGEFADSGDPDLKTYDDDKMSRFQNLLNSIKLSEAKLKAFPTYDMNRPLELQDLRANIHHHHLSNGEPPKKRRWETPAAFQKRLNKFNARPAPTVEKDRYQGLSQDQIDELADLQQDINEQYHHYGKSILIAPYIKTPWELLTNATEVNLESDGTPILEPTEITFTHLDAAGNTITKTGTVLAMKRYIRKVGKAAGKSNADIKLDIKNAIDASKKGLRVGKFVQGTLWKEHWKGAFDAAMDLEHLIAADPPKLNGGAANMVKDQQIILADFTKCLGCTSSMMKQKDLFNWQEVRFLYEKRLRVYFEAYREAGHNPLQRPLLSPGEKAKKYTRYQVVRDNLSLVEVLLQRVSTSGQLRGGLTDINGVQIDHLLPLPGAGKNGTLVYREVSLKEYFKSLLPVPETVTSLRRLLQNQVHIFTGRTFVPLQTIGATSYRGSDRPRVYDQAYNEYIRLRNEFGLPEETTNKYLMPVGQAAAKKEEQKNEVETSKKAAK